VDLRVGCEDAIQGGGQIVEHWSGVDFLEPLSNGRSWGFDEDQELVGVTILMTATEPDRKGIVIDGESPSPVFGIDFASADTGVA